MRIPKSKIYRAFPELDGYSDSQCAALMRRIRGNTIWITCTTVMIVAVMWFVFAASVWIGAVYIASSPGHGIFHENPNPSQSDVIIGLLIVFVPPTVTGFFMRDVLLRLRVYGELRVRLRRLRCSACNYLLLGERAIDNSVICPKCSTAASLQEMGITAADLFPATDGSNAVRARA